MALDEIEVKRIKALYSKKKSGEKEHHNAEDFKFGFDSADDLVRWWRDQFEKQQGQCAYCQTSIDLIKKLIDKDLLRTRRTRGQGKRGKCLELERKEPFGRYEPENCVLVCMCCNNDKSNIYGHEEYMRFFGPSRKKHYDWLAGKLASLSSSEVRVSLPAA
jgi:5-methylcytosine-specific restriction endonuclease McrA